MAGLKRRVDRAADESRNEQKRTKVKATEVSTSISKVKSSKSARASKASTKTTKTNRDARKPSRKGSAAMKDDDMEVDSSDLSFEDENNEGIFDGFSSDASEQNSSSDLEATKVQRTLKGGKSGEKSSSSNLSEEDTRTAEDPTSENGDASSKSRESHAKQKALTQSRKASKPNADAVARCKKLWERLRRKSHVPLEERKVLVAELFDLISGRIKEFVFKHDSVRVIQTALKYANSSQRQAIAEELKGEFKTLAENRYAKFLIGKVLVHDDTKTRDMIVPEYYGHVKRLMRHPEASWILDDIYRSVASKAQKATLLREWYGPEFIIFQGANKSLSETTSADLAEILAETPEKRGPILQYLFESINHLVQKKVSGFTMLHDAMLQYFLAVKPGSTEANEFIEILKGDEEGDLLKNLAFTPCGARLVCLVFAYANAKDRKLLLRVYKDIIKMLAADSSGHLVLLTAFEVIDDTKLTAKSIFSSLLNQTTTSEEERVDEFFAQINDLTARIPILYPFTPEKQPRWLLADADHPVIAEVRKIRAETSKKDPTIRRKELVKAASPSLLEYIARDAPRIISTSFGCRFVTEVLLSAPADDDKESETREAALTAVAKAIKPRSEESAELETESSVPTRQTAHVGRMLKALVQNGRFDTETNSVVKTSPALKFAPKLYAAVEDEVMKWATEINPFVVVALAETCQEEFDQKHRLMNVLGTKENKKILQGLCGGGDKPAGSKMNKAAVERKDQKKGPAASAARLLLEQLE